MERAFSQPLACLSALVVVTLGGLSCRGPGSEVDGGRRSGEPDGPGGQAASSEPVASWTVSDSPRIEIGIREGADEYQLHRAVGSVRLDDDRIVVLNAGSQELRFYDTEGLFLKAVGRNGEGPGEFQDPGSLRRTSDGRLQVWDGGLLRLSIFDADGAFVEARQLLATREEMFPGDEWLLGPNWIVSPVPPVDRGVIRAAVEALPPPDSVHTLRILRVTDQGRLWSPRTWPPAEDPVTWDVYDLQGRKVAEVATPSRFEMHEVGEDYVTGLYRDEVDVNYVRVYDLEKPSGTVVGPGLDRSVADLSDPSLPVGPTPPLASQEVVDEIRGLIRNMAVLQEMHYAENWTYTSDLDALFADPRVDVPDEMAVSILFGGTRGWAGMVTHRESEARCVLAYGFFVPMGWQPGAIICL
jgi:hypothetical protein